MRVHRQSNEEIYGWIYVVPRPPVLCINIWRRLWKSIRKVMSKKRVAELIFYYLFQSFTTPSRLKNFRRHWTLISSHSKRRRRNHCKVTIAGRGGGRDWFLERHGGHGLRRVDSKGGKAPPSRNQSPTSSSYLSSSSPYFSFIQMATTPHQKCYSKSFHTSGSSKTAQSIDLPEPKSLIQA
ncbi:hypothetical protein ACFX2I_047147 [Malus domestica]